jgi:hypothetical protein
MAKGDNMDKLIKRASDWRWENRPEPEMCHMTADDLYALMAEFAAHCVRECAAVAQENQRAVSSNATSDMWDKGYAHGAANIQYDIMEHFGLKE